METAKGKFIVIDGIDGSGKGTQFKILRDRLKDEGYEVVTFDFPQYGKKSAGLVEEYLNGEFGSAEEVGPYAGSLFYAVDRFAAKKEIKEAIDSGKFVISNRYVSASKGHQTSKIQSKEERVKYIDWLNQLEYGYLGLPVPDITFFLHVPASLGYELVLMKEGREYIKGKSQDIHEADKNHLLNAEKAYVEMVEGADQVENWIKIDCCKDNRILTIEEISAKIYDKIVEEKMLSSLVKGGENGS